MRGLKRAGAGLLAACLGFAGLTWWALESGGVARVETRAPDGGARVTHVWYAISAGETWIEAGTPDNAWFRDVGRSSLLTLSIDGEARRYRAEPSRDEAARQRLRSLLRQKYGFRDWWVGLFVDGSRSVPVRLVPAAGDDA